MSETELVDIEQALFAGKPLPNDGPELVIGEDFYEDAEDRVERTDLSAADPISLAVGTPGYMERYMVQECIMRFGDMIGEPEEFDRYYFPPGTGYEGPAPLLIDILNADDLATDREEKHVEFKTQWCAERKVRYALLTDEDLLLAPAALRGKLMGEEPAPAAEPVEPQAPRSRGQVEHPAG